jgi:hypothetical protein
VSGFHELIPADLVNVFDERELELLIGGIADIDVDDWKKHTDYRGYTENDEVIQSFWKVSADLTLMMSQKNTDKKSVYPELGRRTEIAIAAVCNGYFAYSGQRIQGSAG